jgi:hypothetical protein
VSTLATLTSDVQSFTTYDSADFVAMIPTFIRNTEEQVFYTIQAPFFRAAQTGTMTSGNPYLTLPTGFLAASSLSIDTGAEGWKFLLNKDVEYIREVYPVVATTGEPFAYAQFDADPDNTTIIIGPTPDDDYVTQLNYFFKPESLVDVPAGTWLSVNAYKCLLYGTLVEASNWMKRNGGVDNMADTYSQGFVVGLQGLKNLGESRDRKDTYRSGEKRKSEAA